MTRQSGDGDRSAIVLGTGGHVDHGKTTLVRALTGVETDRWKEEQERGLTIDLGFAQLPCPGGSQVAIVDVPGHEDFLKNMLAGATGIDVLLLAVAADEGPMPQTWEHIEIARLLGVRHGVVALTKTDRVEAEWLELVEGEVETMLAATVGRDWPILPVSSVSGEGIEALADAIQQAAATARARAEDDLFRMPVDRSFSVHGTGTVVTGTIWSGRVREGDEVRAMPGEETARVRALQSHSVARSEVGPGRRCAVALVGVEPAGVGRGTWLLDDAPWLAIRRIGARVEVLARPGRAIEHGQRVRLYHGTREVMARVLTAGVERLEPGSAGNDVVLALEQPIVARVRDHFVLRFYSPVTTIGGGRVAELAPPAQWHCRVGEWSTVLDGGPGAAVEAVVRLAGQEGRGDAELPLVSGMAGPAAAAAARASERLMRLDDRWFARASFEAMSDLVIRVVEHLHEEAPRASAVPLSAVREAASRDGHPLLVQAALEELTDAGTLVLAGPRVRTAGHEPRLSKDERDARDRLLEAIDSGGLQPPLVNELAKVARGPRSLLNDLLNLLVEEGEVVAVTPELYLSRPALDRAEAITRRLLARGATASPADFKQAWDVSRKYLIPLLEYFDRTGLTRRSGDVRVLMLDGSTSAR